MIIEEERGGSVYLPWLLAGKPMPIVTSIQFLIEVND